jgi:hypothetical protein
MSERSRTRQAVQMRLLPRAEPAAEWELDDRTRRVGRSGIAQAREVLRRAQPPEPRQLPPVRKAS